MRAERRPWLVPYPPERPLPRQQGAASDAIYGTSDAASDGAQAPRKRGTGGRAAGR